MASFNGFNPSLTFRKLGKPIDVSTFKYVKNGQDGICHVRAVPLNKTDQQTLKAARLAFECLKWGNISEASGKLNGKREQVAELLATSDKTPVKNFVKEITRYAKSRCQNVENEAKFIIKLLQQARLRNQIEEIRRSPYENISAIAARY